MFKINNFYICVQLRRAFWESSIDPEKAQFRDVRSGAQGCLIILKNHYTYRISVFGGHF